MAIARRLLLKRLACAALACACYLLVQTAQVHTTFVLTEVHGMLEKLTYGPKQKLYPTEDETKPFTKPEAKPVTKQVSKPVTKAMIKPVEHPVRNRSDTLLKRHQALKRRCQQLHGDNHRFLNNANFHRGHMIFNDKYKLVYCYIPKIACTNLKRVFAILTGKVNQTDPLEIPHAKVHGIVHYQYLSYLSNFKKNESEVMHRLTNYKKIIFVRNPFERLLSSWRNKFGPTGETNLKQGIGRYIIRHFRNNTSATSYRSVNDVTFGEFIRYVIELDDKRGSFDEHWRKYTDLCHPCEVDYDFVGNFETLDEDMDYLLKDIGISEIVRFPKRNKTYKDAQTADVLTKFYKDIPKQHIMRIHAIYANDFFLFDLKIPAAIQKLLNDG